MSNLAEKVEAVPKLVVTPVEQVFSCVRCHYADMRKHHYCPSCGAVRSFDVAPDWLAKARIERPAMFKRQPKRPVVPEGLEGGSFDGSGGGSSGFDIADPGIGDDNEPDEDDEDEEDEDEDDEDDGPEPGPIEVKTLGKTKTSKIERLSTGDAGFDAVLNGGIPEAHCLMLTGAPGSGKSTMCRLITANAVQQGLVAMYVAAEEATDIIKSEYKRQKLDRKYPQWRNVLMAQSSDPDAIVASAHEAEVDVLVVDSAFYMESRRARGPRGKETQVNYATSLFMEAAHAINRFAGHKPMVVLLIFHMTKDGDMAGSNAAKHGGDGAFSFDHIDPMTLKPVDDQNEPSGYVRLKVHGKYRRGSNTAKTYYKMTATGLVGWVPKNKGASLVVKKKTMPRGR